MNGTAVRMKVHHTLLAACIGVLRMAVPMLATWALAGCADVSYYWQSVNGHIALMRSAKPVQQWLDDTQTPLALREQLELSQQIRKFAVDELALPDNASYQRYADLQRKAVVWNVVAAPAWSLTLKTWCFPVAGCVGYRGYFDEAQAREMALALQSEGLEVSVYGVPAYSTLGWLNWMGGDPLLNTFIHYPQSELARMIFHELAHQVVYLPDDTQFNESFATAVERLGASQWMASQGNETMRLEYANLQARRTQFRALTQDARRVLQDIYDRRDQSHLSDAMALEAKRDAMQRFKTQYELLKEQWRRLPGITDTQLGAYDKWVANANNASLGAQAAYDEWVAHFEALYWQASCDAPGSAGWRRFFAEVKRLRALTPSDRKAAMHEYRDASGFR